MLSRNAVCRLLAMNEIGGAAEAAPLVEGTGVVGEYDGGVVAAAAERGAIKGSSLPVEETVVVLCDALTPFCLPPVVSSAGGVCEPLRPEPVAASGSLAFVVYISG